MHVDLVGEAGVEVADLRPADHQRLPGLRAVRGDHQRVRRVRRLVRDRARVRCRRGLVEAAGVEDHAALGVLGDRAVGEAAVDRGLEVAHLELAQVVEDAHPLLLAEPLDQAAEELRAARLVAAALAHELALERVEGEDVVAGERLVGRGVDRHVVVDPGDEDVDVVEHGLALGAGGLEHGALLGDLGLGLGAGLEVLEPADQPERVEPRGVDRGDARVVAGLLEQQAAILGGDPARGPDAVVVGRGGDVRDVERVALDHDARPRHRFDRRRGRGVDAEALGLEVGGQVAGADLVEQRCQPVVHQRLGVGGGARRDAAVLAGRDHVQRRVGEVIRRCRCGR